MTFNRIEGITKIGKREAFRRLKALKIYKRIPRKKLNEYTRFFVLNREQLGIKKWRGLGEKLGKWLKVTDFRAYTNWKNSHEIIVFTTKAMTSLELTIFQFLN